MFAPAVSAEPLIENTAVDEPAPAFRVAVIDRLPEVSVTLPVGALPEAACSVAVIVATPVCPRVARLVATATVVADVTLTVVATDADALITGLTVVSPMYLAVMELLPQTNELAAVVILAIAVPPEGVTGSVPSATVPS
jgi:hypothetical protein